MKGSVVHIPVEINDMISVLPRNFHNVYTIQLRSKRHVTHASDYLFEGIRPAIVCEALSFTSMFVERMEVLEYRQKFEVELSTFRDY